MRRESTTARRPQEWRNIKRPTAAALARRQWRPRADLDSLLPDRWLAEHPQRRWTIADRRQEERAAKGRL